MLVREEVVFAAHVGHLQESQALSSERLGSPALYFPVQSDPLERGYRLCARACLITADLYTTIGMVSTIVPPYQVSNTADYAIEANIQLISYGYVGEGSSSFGISLRGTSTTNGWQGYTGGLLAFNEYQRYMQITGPDIFGALKRGDFDPGSTSSHTYRVEVKGNDIKLLIDGSIRLEVTDNRYLSGAQVGFWCFGPQISVSSFKVFAL